MDFEDWMEHVVQGFEVVGFSLEIELDGVVPWRRAATTGPRAD